MVGNTTKQLNHTPPPKKNESKLKGWWRNVWYPCNNSAMQIAILQTHQIFSISYFPKFNFTLAFERQVLRPSYWEKLKQCQSRAWTKRDLQILKCIGSFAIIGSSCLSKQPIMVNPVGSKFTSPKLWAWLHSTWSCRDLQRFYSLAWRKDNTNKRSNNVISVKSLF